jgi:hypothetical protein
MNININKLTKENIINFLKFIDNKNNQIIQEEDILIFYNNKTNILYIDNNEFLNLTKNYNLNDIINMISILFKSHKIEYPFIKKTSGININIIKNTLNTISNIYPKLKLHSKDNEKHIFSDINDLNNLFLNYTNNSIFYNELIDIPLEFNKKLFPKNFDFDIYKNKLNYFLIYYFSEKDILLCKKLLRFLSPYELIYSNNNFLEKLIENILNEKKEINSQILKDKIIKSTISCPNTEIIDIISIINFYNNISINNIINIGVDWGEFNFIAYCFPNKNIKSFYINIIDKSIFTEINDNLNISHNNITNELINLNENHTINDDISIDFLYINIEFIINFLIKDEKKSSIEHIYKEYIIPLIKNYIYKLSGILIIPFNINNKISIIKNIILLFILNLLKLEEKKFKIDKFIFLKYGYFIIIPTNVNVSKIDYNNFYQKIF